jgi:hypothetical protein
MSKMLLRIALLLSWFFINAAVYAQVTGGRHVFQFMTLSPSARISGLGGMQIAVKDDDIAFAAANPAALNETMSGRITFQHNFFLSDIQHGYAAYAHHLRNWGFTVHGGVQYVNYGEIKRTDQFGTLLGGEVAASETALTFGGAKVLTDKVSLGLNVRMGFSALDANRSSALAADAGLMFADTARRLTIGIVLRNAGVQMRTYNDKREELPFDLQIGISKRLTHLPFRFSIIAHHLHDWDIRYDDPNLQDDDVLLFGDEEPKKNKGNALVDNFFRHLVFNGEFLLGRNEGFRIRFGYNHLRKKELSVRNYRSMAGFTGGVGIKINRFRLDVGVAPYHLAGGIFHVGLGTNLQEFF